MDLELELISDKAEKYGGHAVALARVNVVALSSQPVDQDKRLMNDPNERLCQEFSDEEEEFSSEGEAEGSDSEPTLEVHRRKSRGKIRQVQLLLSKLQLTVKCQCLNFVFHSWKKPNLKQQFFFFSRETLNKNSSLFWNDSEFLRIWNMIRKQSNKNFLAR